MKLNFEMLFVQANNLVLQIRDIVYWERQQLYLKDCIKHNNEGKQKHAHLKSKD